MSHWLGVCPPPLLRAGTWLGRSYACRHSLLEFAHVSVTLCLGDTVSTEAPITSGFYHLSAFFSAQIPEPWVERCNTDILEMFFLSLENQLWSRLPRDSPTCRGCSLVWELTVEKCCLLCGVTGHACPVSYTQAQHTSAERCNASLAPSPCSSVSCLLPTHGNVYIFPLSPTSGPWWLLLWAHESPGISRWLPQRKAPHFPSYF